jgi:hypothetical protein
MVVQLDGMEKERAFREALTGLSDTDLGLMAMQSPAVHFSACVKIQDKNNDAIRPTPNILQLRMSEVYEVCMAMGVPCRMVCCKPRQVGCSTFASHIVYHHGMRYRTAGITISDKSGNSQKLMLKVRDYSHVDQFPWRIKMKRDASGALEWTNGTRWEIDSAENWKAGIGDTRQAFHASEVGKWPKNGIKNDKRVMSAVLPSISKGRSVVIAESTPEGAGGWMYETWQSAVTLDEFIAMHEAGKDTGVVWIKVFAAWFEFEEHQRKTPVSELERVEIDRTLGEREISGRELYGWTYEQIAWRRDMIRLECGGSEDVFDEYYAEDDVRCWAVSGRPRFNVQALMLLEKRAAAGGGVTGHLVTQESGLVTWNPRSDGGGDVMVFEEPREGCRYLAGCDPATGASQTVGKNPDRSSIQVWRQGYWDPVTGMEVRTKLVARVRSPYFGDGDEVAGHLVRLSRWYGGCLVVPEVNMGLHVVEHLKEAGVPIYRRIVPSAKVGSVVEQYGFKLTDREQRRMLVEALATAIRECVIDIPCKDAVRELRMFVTGPDGRDEARHGEHDDDVLCAAMCWYSMPSATEYRRVLRKRKVPKDAANWKRVGAVRRGW